MNGYIIGTIQKKHNTKDTNQTQKSLITNHLNMKKKKNTDNLHLTLRHTMREQWDKDIAKEMS
jgi:hypothetical protein